MKQFLFALTILGAMPAVAQEQANGARVQEEYSDTHALSGAFRHWNGVDSVNVNYRFAPAAPAGKVSVSFHTPEAQPLWLTVTKASGIKVAEWRPQQQNYKQDFQLDLSRLSAGKYEYHICWGKEQDIQVIPFVKH